MNFSLRVALLVVRRTLRAADHAQRAAARNRFELILDASGSMLQRMDGRRRINVVKEVLTNAVRELIPAGTPVALRVFGHREPNACRTDLDIPLAPLNADAAAATLEGIQAMNLARTPIAASLAAVELEQGIYRVVVKTAKPRIFDSVEVQGEADARLEL